MRSHIRFASFFAFLLLSGLAAGAQTTYNSPTDATWAKLYATDCGPAVKHPCPPSTNGYEGEFTGDPRFLALVKQSLPQQESWWVNGYGGSAPISKAVQEFLGEPHNITLDDDRYITADGCVPHACMIHGMLWIDTTTKPATVIFVGETLVAGGLKGESGDHLYLYTSRKLATYYAGKRPIKIFDPQFLRSLARWHDANVSKYDTQKIILATIVWPNGATHDLFWSDLLQPPPLPTSN